jgi:hypothetical protein
MYYEYECKVMPWVQQVEEGGTISTLFLGRVEFLVLLSLIADELGLKYIVTQDRV